MTKELEEYLDRMGYKAWFFSRDTSTYSEDEAKRIVDLLREHGDFARIICHATRLRIREFSVCYRPKKTACGT